MIKTSDIRDAFMVGFGGNSYWVGIPKVGTRVTVPLLKGTGTGKVIFASRYFVTVEVELPNCKLPVGLEYSELIKYNRDLILKAGFREIAGNLEKNEKVSSKLTA